MEMNGLMLLLLCEMLNFGICTMECDFKSVGPKCNFKNIAYKLPSRHDSNIEKPRFSDLANDGSLSTCSYTSENNKHKPWWNLWLSEYTTIKKLEFLTIDSRRRHFQYFTVKVYNTSKENFERKGHLERGTDCYKHSNSVPPDTKIQVTCDGSPVGNIIRLQLYSKLYQLVLCDFRLYGDCNDLYYGNDCEHRCSENCNSPRQVGDRYCRLSDGVCLNGCKPGWKGQRCEKVCDDGSYGIGCESSCSVNCSVPCDKETGTCSHCKAGWKGNYCTKICEKGVKWGPNCTHTCGHCDNSECDRFNGICPGGCAAGFKGQTCTEECGNDYYGKNCTRQCENGCSRSGRNDICDKQNGRCLNGCKAGYKGLICNEVCEKGVKWGPNCTHTCGHCDNSECDRFNGICPGGCAAGFKGQTCIEECGNGYYGKNCTRQCENGCSRSRRNDICDKQNGRCLNGCKAGYKGLICNEDCGGGKWGKDCQNDCGHCLSSPCNNVNGNCIGGCAAGYKYTWKCNTACDDRTYGIRCKGRCSKNCKDVCDKKTGMCSNCKSGWKGNNCSEKCSFGKWGENCLHRCGKCKNEETCSRFNGICRNGCLPGYKHTEHCNDECDDGTYGDACVSNCSVTCQGVCNKINGTCDQCQNGWTGDFCETATSPRGSKSMDELSASSGGIVASVIAILVVGLFAAGVVYIFYTRNLNNRSRNEANRVRDLNTDRSNPTRKVSKEEPNSSTLYVNMSSINKALETRAKFPGRCYVNNVVKERANEIEQAACCNPNNANAEYLSKFEAYVNSRLANPDLFVKQFQQIPYGMQYASDVATKPVNHGKNRYKSMYAYDHSRVILRTLPDIPGSDYINASKIMTETGKVAYIAAQGPITNTLGDFWRMIWEQNVRTIVVLTNLTEEGKMKCIQYWPEVGELVQYGNITVLSELEDVFTEFTIRRLKIQQMNKPDKTRILAHFHYTAWPDKDVPKSTSSLLHFLHQVRKHDGQKSRPWLVHCSAGVGRTGTFVGLDVLYDIGTSGGSIDVFKCVDDLRKQRVNMVQTKGQYKYLHCVVLEALVLPSRPAHMDNFHSIYNDLKMTDPKTGKTALLMQYETLANGSGVYIDDKDDERYVVAKKDENRHKNRYNDILAPSDCRPFLLTKVPGCTDYINAVFIPGYRDKFGYIITQTPLQSTAVDCCRLIHEQDIKVIVTFQEYDKKDVGNYLSYKEAEMFGPFTIKFISEADRACYTRRNYLLIFKSETHTLTQLIFKSWSPSRLTPSDPTEMLNFLENLDSIRKQAELKPVLVQCLNGAERSGLVVVLANILEQMKFNKEVSIPLVIRQLKSRRQQIIPNFEQYKFCYDVILSHIESHTTYANM